MNKMSLDKIVYIFTLGMLTAFGPICTDIYLPALPAITADFQTDASTIQLSLTSCFLGLALGQIFVGPLSDTFGRKIPLLVSLVVFVITSALCATANDVMTMVFLRFFQGFSGAGGVVLSRSMACDLFPGTELTKFMALIMTVNSLAPILGPILGSAVIVFFSWRGIFGALVIVGLILVLLSVFKIPDTLPKDKREPKVVKSITGMLKELRNLRFLFITLSMAFIMGGFFSYLAASPFVVQNIYGFSAVGYSVIFAVNAVAITLAAQLAGRLSTRIGDVKVVFLSLAVMFISSIIMLVIAFINPQTPVPALAAILFYVAMIGSSQTAGFGLAMGSRKGGAGAASGIFGVLIFIFGALFSPLVGIMGEMSMIPLALNMFFAVVFSYILFKLGLKKRLPFKK